MITIMMECEEIDNINKIILFFISVSQVIRASCNMFRLTMGRLIMFENEIILIFISLFNINIALFGY